MEFLTKYNAVLTAEQFLFYEIRIVSRMFLDKESLEDIIKNVRKDNLFQYPTERHIHRLTRACYKRLVALDNQKLVYELASAPDEVAKQINLYAMMRYNRLVREFMTDLVGEKYRQHDYSCTKKDINVFFSQLRGLNDDIANWSDQTIQRLKQVLTRCLVEVEMLDSPRASELNPVLISAELESGIRENNDLEALAAFNCFR